MNAVPGQAHRLAIAQVGQAQQPIAQLAVLLLLLAQPAVLLQLLARTAAVMYLVPRPAAFLYLVPWPAGITIASTSRLHDWHRQGIDRITTCLTPACYSRQE